MAFKEVQSSFAEPWKPADKELKHPTTLIGRFAGKEMVPSPQKPGEFFESYRVSVRDAKDPKKKTTYGVSGAFLKSKLNQVPAGALVKLVYVGLDEKNRKKGFNAPKDIKVYVDDNIDLLDPDGLDADASDGVHVSDE